MIHPDGNAQDIAGVTFGVKSLIRLLKKILYREQMSRSATDVFNLRFGRAEDDTSPDTETASEPASAEPHPFSRFSEDTTIEAVMQHMTADPEQQLLPSEGGPLPRSAPTV